MTSIQFYSPAYSNSRVYVVLKVLWFLVLENDLWFMKMIIDFQEKNSDPDIFTPDLLYFQFFHLIWHLLEVFLPDIIPLLALSMIVLL